MGVVRVNSIVVCSEADVQRRFEDRSMHYRVAHRLPPPSEKERTAALLEPDPFAGGRQSVVAFPLQGGGSWWVPVSQTSE
jgi:hypothetical protein